MGVRALNQEIYGFACIIKKAGQKSGVSKTNCELAGRNYYMQQKIRNSVSKTVKHCLLSSWQIEHIEGPIMWLVGWTPPLANFVI